MKILITGTTGYIAKRLILQLLENRHELFCCVRDLLRIPKEWKDHANMHFIEVDFLEIQDVELPMDIDAAYYLIHSMASKTDNFEELEKKCASNFRLLVEKTACKQVIYLSGIVNDASLSPHLRSRLMVEETLKSEEYALTTFRAGIIVGSGSASFEIIRDIVEKLPIMVTPKWLNTRTQPIAIRDVLHFLCSALGKKDLFNTTHDVFGPEILTYKEMLLQFAEVRKLKRHIFTLPVLTPKLSSYWLYFVTSTSFPLARALVDSMKVEVIGKPSDINRLMDIKPLPYKKAVQLAFQKIQQNEVVSSWKNAVSSGVFNEKLCTYVEVPHYGCFKDERSLEITDEQATLEKIWGIGGENGWYSHMWLWRVRGYLDKLFGGVGLRRGRTDLHDLEAGDPVDFWRVLLANKKEKRLLLFAEMRLPGEAWLEFKIEGNMVHQRAVFRPKGLMGRLYWYSVLPFHGFVFSGMIKAIANAK